MVWKTFTKDPREPYFVLSAHLLIGRFENEWGFLTAFHQNIFSEFLDSVDLLAWMNSSPKSYIRMDRIGSFRFDDLTDQ